MRRAYLVVGLATLTLLLPTRAAAETCGNHVDDDSDALTDEGCWPDGVTGTCTQPGGCAKNGWVAPREGQLVWPEPADLSPAVAYGSAIDFKRTYFGQYSPGYQDPNDTDFRAPLGRNWQHNWMSFLDRVDSGQTPVSVVVHLRTGQDVYFASPTSCNSTWTCYTSQAGYHFQHLRQNTSSPYQWELKDYQGWVFEYDFNTGTKIGKLAKVTDSIGNVVTVTYNGDGQVQNVLDATGNRGLEFSYYSSTDDKLLQYVKYRTYSGGTGTDRVTLEFVYSSYKLTTAKIGTGTPATFRSYSYDSRPNLTKIEDGEGTAKTIAEFKYLAPTGGALTAKVVRIETADGTYGWEYSASGCANGSGTYVTYQRSSASSGCSSCAGDEYCGGKTDLGDSSTGLCFEARVCLAFAATTPNGKEDLVGAITASCDACTDIAEFAWDTTNLDLVGRRSSRANGGSELWTSYRYDSGRVVRMVEGDDNENPDDTNPSAARDTWFYYDSTFPGLLTETRRRSELNTTDACDEDTGTSGCKRTINSYTSAGLLDTVQQIGFTEVAAATPAPESFTYTTDYSYDAQGRVTQIDGPRTDTSYDIVEFTYWASSGDVLKEYFLKEVKRKKGSSSYLTTTLSEYDHWGNPAQHKPPEPDLTCQAFDGARNILTSRRKAMANQTDCSTVDDLDETTVWTYDTALRMTKEQHERGDCIHYEFDSLGRISKRKDRDDCNAASNGDTMEYTYSADGLLTKLEYKDGGGTATWRQEHTYRADRRLAKTLNPVDTDGSKFELKDYTNDGLLRSTQSYDGTTQFGGTDWIVDALGRLDLEKRYLTSNTSDDWDLAPGAQLDQPTEVEDEDSKAITWLWDDLGRKVRQVTPDAGTNWYKYDRAGNLTEVILAYGTADTVTNTYTYDSLDRLTAENTGDTSCGGEQGAEMQYVYDATPSGCPSGQTCSNLVGRLTYVKLKLACDTSKSDDTIDLETFYAYDRAGRLTREFIQDDTGRTALTTYIINDNGHITQIVPPSALKFTVVRGDADHNSDMDKIERVNRIEDGDPTTMVASITWMPFGPVDDSVQQNKQNNHKVIMRPTYNLAYRATELLWEEASSGTDLFKIAYTEDETGRITIRDFTGAASGVQDAVYLYDWHDRVTCDAVALNMGACPTSGSNLKSNMSASPPFTQSNDRKEMKHSDPLVGEETYVYALVSGKDQIDCVQVNGSSTCTTDAIDFSWDTRGNRTADNDTRYTNDLRTYTYDARNNLATVAGDYLYASNDWNPYTITNVYDHKNRRIFKSFLDSEISEEAQWYFTYDQLHRLVEVKHIPDTDVTTTYSIYDFYWIDDRPVAYYQLDFASGQGTVTTRRFLHADEINRPHEAWSWPSSGDAARVWAINPDLFGWDYIATGVSIYQPLRFPGQHYDSETVAHRPNGANASVARPGLHENRRRVFDPFAGGYLQNDPLVAGTWEPYAYAGQNPIANVNPTGEGVADVLCYVGTFVIGVVIQLNGDRGTGQWVGEAGASHCGKLGALWDYLTGPACPLGELWYWSPSMGTMGRNGVGFYFPVCCYQNTNEGVPIPDSPMCHDCRGFVQKYGTGSTAHPACEPPQSGSPSTSPPSGGGGGGGGGSLEDPPKWQP